VRDDSSANAQRGPAQSSYIVRPGPDDGRVVAPTSNADSVAECGRVLDSLASPPPVRVDGDFISLIRSLNTPALPVPGYENVRPNLPLGRYPDVESYVRADRVVGVDVSSQLLAQNGYVVAEAEGFTHGGSQYGAEGIQFRNSGGADNYNHMQVLQLCRSGLVSNIRLIRGVADGLSLTRTDEDMSARAYLVIGNTLVHLNICSCVGVRDLQTLADQWARRVEARSAAIAPSPGEHAIPPATPGADSSATIARQNLDLAAGIVQRAMRAHPNRAITESDLNASGSRFMWDIPDAPIGDPGTLGTAAVSTYIGPASPQRVVLALPDNGECDFVEVRTDVPNRYGVDSSAGASPCFVGQARNGSLQRRPGIKWYDNWPAG
jgi:hypothetical protein